MRARVVVLAALAVCCALALSCARRATSYLDPEADFSLIRRVAVLPMENLTNEITAGEKVRQLLMIELLASGSVEVVDVGEVGRALSAQSVVKPMSPGTEEIRKLGKELGVQALLGGSVQEFSQGRASGAQATAVSLAFRMVETDTGRVVWSSNVSQSGVGAMSRLFGVGGDSATDRAHKLIRKALRSLVR